MRGHSGDQSALVSLACFLAVSLHGKHGWVSAPMKWDGRPGGRCYCQQNGPSSWYPTPCHVQTVCVMGLTPAHRLISPCYRLCNPTVNSLPSFYVRY
ncbi:hypothetical protein BS47DRAFT_595711 [Hydnum rufescens UP504]|uniref:Secreted protein n=1 Tax=Hydnum rufescens UP504 TaxID=1448309 RepID=A0A9P6DX30_9AGAM|nr:hypothetical protein BS47DRAFT_595711 [Hydnum rufescens UP504]